MKPQAEPLAQTQGHVQCNNALRSVRIAVFLMFHGKVIIRLFFFHKRGKKGKVATIFFFWRTENAAGICLVENVLSPF